MNDKKKICYICGDDHFIDDHHYDCREGKISPETVPLCRRCHRTYHNFGVEWFDDEYLDRAIEVENKKREIHKSPPMKKEDIKRSDYFNKTHGLSRTRRMEGSRTPLATFHLPNGNPLCGWQWVNAHMHDLDDWVPRIEIMHPGFHLTANVTNKKELKDTIKAIKGLKEIYNGRV